MAKQIAIVCNGVEHLRTTPEGRTRIAELQAACIRLRNFGGSIATIADKLKTTEEVVELLLTQAVRELTADDAQAVTARQQATVNDIRRAMYPAMEQGDEKAANVIIKVMAHEAQLHPGVLAPTRVRIGMDQDAFTTTVDEDIRALGVHPQMDTALDEEDEEPWSNT